MPPKPRISPAARRRINALLSRYTGHHLVRDAASHKPVTPAKAKAKADDTTSTTPGTGA